MASGTMDDSARLMEAEPDPVVRDGALDADSLAAALVDERRRGRVPRQLAVADADLEVRALYLLGGDAPLDDLRSSVPNVIVDPELPEGAWQIRDPQEAAAA